MIPLYDLNPSRRRPYVTYALIAANVLCFFYELSLSDRALEAFVRAYGVVPYELTGAYLALTQGHWVALGEFHSLLTSMFLHGGWLHLAGNMLFLYVFGDNVEDRFGPWRYLSFYMLAGVFAAGAQIWAEPTSTVPIIGASGAIGGVLGAYVVLFPGAQVQTLLVLGFFLLSRRLPAWILLGMWFAIQGLQGFLTMRVTSGAGGVAFWAHVGGFLAGAAAAGAYKAFAPQRSPHADRWYSNR